MLTNIKKNLRIIVTNNSLLYKCAQNFLKVTNKFQINISYFFKRILLLFRKKYIAPIKYCSVEKYIKDNKLFNSFIEIYPKHEIIRSKPHSIDDKIHWKFEIGSRSLSPSVFVMKLDNGYVYSDNGIVFTADNIVIEDVSRPMGKTIGEADIFKKVTLPISHYIDATVVVISTYEGNGFFHWMFDVLPRINIIKKSGYDFDYILVNDIHSKFQEETLRLLGVLDKIITLSPNKCIQANKLLVPSLPGNTGNMPKWACEFLYMLFTPFCEVTNSNKKRLYISRSKTNRRRVLNETEVISILEPLGFEVVFSEEITFKEQINLFCNAEVIVAPHGAGLSNLVFCQKKTRILELFSPNYVNVCYYALSNMMELDYYYLIGDGKRPPEFYDPLLDTEDMIINVGSLKEILNKMGL